MKALDDDVESPSNDSGTLVSDISVTGDRSLNEIFEVPVISKGGEFVDHVAAETFRLNGQLVAELGPAVNEDDDVVDVEAREDVAGAASAPSGELGRDHNRRCDRAYPHSGSKPSRDRRVDPNLIPRIGKPEHLFRGRHHIDRKTRLAVTGQSRSRRTLHSPNWYPAGIAESITAESSTALLQTAGRRAQLADFRSC